MKYHAVRTWAVSSFTPHWDYTWKLFWGYYSEHGRFPPQLALFLPYNLFLLLPNVAVRCSASLSLNLNATNLKTSWTSCAAVLFSANPIRQTSKFREIAAFAKRTTGNGLGLIDSMARYRRKLWWPTEGHRQVLRLSFTKTAQSALYSIHLKLSTVSQISTINGQSHPYVSYIYFF